MWYCESCILILTYNIWKFLILEIIINGNKKIIFKDNYYLKLLFLVLIIICKIIKSMLKINN